MLGALLPSPMMQNNLVRSACLGSCSRHDGSTTEVLGSSYVLTKLFSAASQLLHPDDVQRLQLDPPPAGGKSFHDMYLDVSFLCTWQPLRHQGLPAAATRLWSVQNGAHVVEQELHPQVLLHRDMCM
jgi:hypothetical protein